MTAKIKSKAKKNTAGIPQAVDFKSLNKTQRRVAIAQDVIAALLAKRYKATCGSYVYSNATAKGTLSKEEQSTLAEQGYIEIDVQKALAQNMKSCEVCAKGAMFVAAVEKFDQLKIEVSDEHESVLTNFTDNQDVCDHLSNYFDQDQLDLIEAAFEGGDFAEFNGTSDLQNWVLDGWAHVYPKTDVRMIAIMENIVRNKGKFVITVAELFAPLMTKVK